MSANIRPDRCTRVAKSCVFQPHLNDAINEEWISDKTRFVWDGLRRQRLDRPYIPQKERRAATPRSWGEAFRRHCRQKAKATTPGEERRHCRRSRSRRGAQGAKGSRGARSARRPILIAGRMAPKLELRWPRQSYLFNTHSPGLDAADGGAAGRLQPGTRSRRS